MPITSPVERISGPSRVSTPGKRPKGSTASLTLTYPPAGGRHEQPSGAELGEGDAHHHPGRHHRHGTPVALATNGTVRLARGLASMHVTCPVLHRELDVHEPDDAERLGDRPGVRLDRGR